MDYAHHIVGCGGGQRVPEGGTLMTHFSAAVHESDERTSTPRAKARSFIHLLRLSSSGALAGMAISGILGAATGFFVAGFHLPDWVGIAAAAIGFAAVTLASIAIHRSDR